MLVSPIVSSSFLTSTFLIHTALQLVLMSVFSLGYLGMANTGPCVGPHSKIGCPSLSYHHKHFTQQECKQASKLQLVKDIDRQSCVVCIATDCE